MSSQTKKADWIFSKNDYLPELLNRAVKNIKPFRGGDKGMRDAVIWLSIKDYCLAAFEKQVIFLTGNVSDFAESKEIPKLHQVLEDECRALNIRVNLYKSVLDFVNEHSAKLSFITDDWILETVSDNLDKDIFEDLIANLRGRFLSDWARDRHVDIKDRDYKVRYIEDFVIEDFGIYEMLNDEYLVFAVVNLLAGIEFDWYDYDYQFGPVNGGTTSESFRFHVGVSFKVKGATVTEFDFGEVTEA